MPRQKTKTLESPREMPEIYEQLMQAEEAEDECVTRFPEKTFEQGVAHALRWILGNEPTVPPMTTEE